jgi:hypothetical protein
MNGKVLIRSITSITDAILGIKDVLVFPIFIIDTEPYLLALYSGYPDEERFY